MPLPVGKTFPYEPSMAAVCGEQAQSYIRGLWRCGGLLEVQPNRYFCAQSTARRGGVDDDVEVQAGWSGLARGRVGGKRRRAQHRQRFRNFRRPFGRSGGTTKQSDGQSRLLNLEDKAQRVAERGGGVQMELSTLGRWPLLVSAVFPPTRERWSIPVASRCKAGTRIVAPGSWRDAKMICTQKKSTMAHRHLC